MDYDNDDTKVAAGCLIALVIFAAMAFYGWYSGGWERGYQRERIKRHRRVQERIERNYDPSQEPTPYDQEQGHYGHPSDPHAW